MEKNHILLDDSSFPVNQNNEYEPELLARAATSLIDSSLRAPNVRKEKTHTWPWGLTSWLHHTL